MRRAGAGKGRAAFAAALVAFFSGGSTSLSQTLARRPAPLPTSGPVALPDWARSVRIVRGDEPLWTRPTREAPRRGAARLNAHLPVYAARIGDGCAEPWLHVGPEAWLCGEGGELSGAPPLSPHLESIPHEQGLPYRYFFVQELGALGYRDLATAEMGPPDLELEPGFALAVARTADRFQEPFGLTPHGFWIPMRDLRPARPSSYQGVAFPAVDEEPLDPREVIWTIGDQTPVHRAPGGPVVERLPRQTRLRAWEHRSSGGRSWVRVGVEQWIPNRLLARIVPGELPANLAEQERWIDVDLHEQVLTAYEGERPVFAALVATGRGYGQAENATPLGEHRIWVKLVASDMSNLEATEASRYYSMQSVPWVMYFKRGYGLHGTYWHDDFGRRRSQGCINLSPADAARLFFWTEPRLPAGWTAILPGRYEQGTLIRVRSSKR